DGKHDHRESPKPDHRTVASRASVLESGDSASKRDAYNSASGADSKSEKSQRGRQRPTSNRTFSSEAVAVTAAAAAASSTVGLNPEGASASRPRSPADPKLPALATSKRGAPSGGGGEKTNTGSTDRHASVISNTPASPVDKHPDSGHVQDGKRTRERDRDSGGRNRGREYDRVRSRQQEADQRYSPRHADADRRESRSVRVSPSVQS
ncbi:hypothetical protein GGI22_005327, partial [Coemansia erecta]